MGFHLSIRVIPYICPPLMVGILTLEPFGYLCVDVVLSMDMPALAVINLAYFDVVASYCCIVWCIDDYCHS